jgi:hypothetical protein
MGLIKELHFLWLEAYDPQGAQCICLTEIVCSQEAYLCMMVNPLKAKLV